MANTTHEASSHILEWIIGIGSFLTAITGFLAFVFKKKTLTDVEIVKALRQNHTVEEILARINSEFVDAEITSVLAITDHDIPLNYQTLFSTDYQTHHIWKRPVLISPELSRILVTVSEVGYGSLPFKQVLHPRLNSWFGRNEIAESHMFSIGAGFYHINGKDQWVWLVLVVNWRSPGELDGNTMLRIQEYLVDIQDNFKERSRKRFIYTPPKLKGKK